MKYAIISDVHGNHHAFEAVIADARAQGVDMFLLLGDYTNSFPYGNDVVETLRKLNPIFAIQGNGEGYLMNLRGQNPLELTHEQFKPVYWGYQTLSHKNYEYLANLPKAMTISDLGTEIHLAHTMNLFYRTPEIKLFHSHHRRAMMNSDPFTHAQYLIRARNALLSCHEAMLEMIQLPKGIYLFGHNHMQFHMEHDGRLFINPGSCGEPLDWNTDASYTILTLSESKWDVAERRVKYNLDLVADGLVDSGFSAYAPMWSEIMKLELFSAKDYFMAFVVHVIETGRKMGFPDVPVNNAVWDVAVKSWDADVI